MADQLTDQNFEAQIDEIYQNANESTNNEVIPMSEQPKDDAAAAANANQARPESYEFVYKGKTIKGTREDVLKWASMGYDAPNRIGELNKKLQDFEGKTKHYESRYKDIDEWATKNPEAWNSLTQAWQEKLKTMQAQNPNQQLPPEVLEKLQKVDEISNALQQQEFQKQDQELDSEIKSIRDKYKNLDFDARDSQGKSLEYRILEHAQQNGIKKFTTAFRDYCADQLVELAKEQGKESAAKSVQKNNRIGLVGKSSTPSAKGSAAPDVKGMSYNQIHNQILADLGLGE